jgi:hypothetical protein
MQCFHAVTSKANSVCVHQVTSGKTAVDGLSDQDQQANRQPA